MSKCIITNEKLGIILSPSYPVTLQIISFWYNKAWFQLVLRIIRIWDFYDFPVSGILTTHGNTPSQTVGDVYDVIARIGSISTLKIHPRWSPMSVIFTMSVNIKLPVWGIGDAWFSLFLLPKLEFQWINDHKCIILSTAVKLEIRKRRVSCIWNFVAWKVKRANQSGGHWPLTDDKAVQLIRNQSKCQMIKLFSYWKGLPVVVSAPEQVNIRSSRRSFR